MIRLIAGTTLLMLLGGCTVLNERLFSGAVTSRDKLTEAVRSLERGNELFAFRLLEEIGNSPEKINGVTDEALFRLSLLGIRRHNEPAGMQLVHKSMARLRKEFPESSWTRQLLPTMEYVAENEVANSEIRTLKQRNNALLKETRELTSANQTLAKDNRELNLRIEKLKSLDLELELKNRR